MTPRNDPNVAAVSAKAFITTFPEEKWTPRTIRAWLEPNRGRLFDRSFACKYLRRSLQKGPNMKFSKVMLLVAMAVFAAVRWTAVANDAKKDAVREELEKLAGTWQFVSSEKDGKRAPEDELKQVKLIITGENYTVERAGKTVEEGWIDIDPAQNPKTIDIYPTKPAGKVTMGIYERDGDDQIRGCTTHPGTRQTRPTQFSTTKGSGHVMSVCKREKVK